MTSNSGSNQSTPLLDRTSRLPDTRGRQLDHEDDASAPDHGWASFSARPERRTAISSDSRNARYDVSRWHSSRDFVAGRSGAQPSNFRASTWTNDSGLAGGATNSASRRPFNGHQEAEVIRGYTPDSSEDLPLEFGQTVNIVRVVDGNWYAGYTIAFEGSQRFGIFPRSHVSLREPPLTRPQTQGPQLPPARARTLPMSDMGQCGPSCALQQAARVRLDPPALNPIGIGADNTVLQNMQTMTPSIFVDLKPWQTRIIKLKRGSRSSRLECDLKVVELIDPPGCAIASTSEVVQFAALSYSWISDELAARISVNNTTWVIPNELARALLYLRSEDFDRYLWCDALCIDQKNPEEKALQIRNMLRIFEKAERVIAWLGAPHESSGRLVAAFDLFLPDENLADRKHNEQCKETLEGLTAALRHHLSNHWFLRTWVRQEVFAAKELILSMGGHDLNFELFNAKIGVIHMLCNPKDRLLLTRAIEKPRTLEVLQREFQHFGTDRLDFVSSRHQKEFSEHWLEVLRSGPLFGVTEERDRVYGCLGILTSSAIKYFARLHCSVETLVKEFPVSYDAEKPLGEVFGDVCKFLVNITGLANVLDFWRIPKGDRKLCEGLASWAVDWRYFDGSVLPSVLSREGAYDRAAFVSQPKQKYGGDGRLDLRGVKMTASFYQISALREKSDGPVLEQRESAESLLEKISCGELKCVTIWFEEEEEAGRLAAHMMEVNLQDLPDVVLSIRQERYCLADAEDVGRLSGISRFIVSQRAQLNDSVVSFHGSQYLHLIRPRIGTELTYRYLGPVLPLMTEGANYAFQQGRSGLQNARQRGMWMDSDAVSVLEAESFALV